MKKFLVWFLAFIMVINITACGSDTQKNDSSIDTKPASTDPTPDSSGDADKVKDYSGQTLIFGTTYGNNFEAAMNETIIPMFKEKYGADVIIDPSYDYTKLVAEGGAPSVDVLTVDDTKMYEGKDLGVFMPLDFSKIPNSENLYEDAFDPYGNGVYVYWGQYGIVYNTKMIPEAPTSWKDLWKDEYAGKVAINSPKGTGGCQFLVMTSYVHGGNEGDMDPAWDALKTLAPNLLTVADNTSALVDIMTRGDAWIAPCWDGRAYAMKNSGVPVDFVAPEEGALATVAELVIPEGSQNVELAYLFIDMCLSEEGQKAISTWTRYGPVNKNVTFEGQDAEEIYMASDQNGLVVVDWLAIAPLRNNWIDTFDREITGLLN